MWGNNNNSMNSSGYPQQNQNIYPQQQQMPPQNQSKIPLSPGVALLGIVGQNTMKQNQDQWRTGDANYNYPVMGQSQFSNMQAPYGYQQQPQQHQPMQQPQYGQNANNPYLPQPQTQPQQHPYSMGQGQAQSNLTPPPLPYTPQNQWQGHKLQNYMLNKMILDQYIPTIFAKWDANRSGTIEMHEFPGMINELFRCMNLPPPSQNDMWYLMWKFDQDQNGKIDYMEWANMVYTLGGLRSA